MQEMIEAEQREEKTNHAIIDLYLVGTVSLGSPPHFFAKMAVGSKN